MPNQSQLARHARLVDHMADALGVDLDEQIQRGRLSSAELEDAVLSCTNCTQPCACDAWLGTSTDAAPEAPGYCRNARLFETLRGS